MNTIRSRAEVRDFFKRNETPLYYFSTSTFNLLGLDEWVDGLTFINSIDSFAGRHPRVFIPPGELEHGPPTIEAVNNVLLDQAAVADLVRRSGPGGAALFMMFDAEGEERARKLGLGVAFPSASLRQHLDNKVTTTELANRAGVPSVPNVLAQVDSYDTLRRVASDLGPDLVIQLPYGDSGATTFFVSSEADFRAHAGQIAAEPAVKIMRRIRCRQTTIEGCVTRRGTLVGPLMTEMIGFPELTPYGGGWCGNEVFGAGESTTLSPDVRRQARTATTAMGDELRREGYWGVFGLDFLIDQDTGALYLGEMNPRITGATLLTSLAAQDQAEVPLFVCHLLEWLGADYALEVEAFNARWGDAQRITSWSQLVIEHTGDEARTATQVPAAGIWRLVGDGTLEYARPTIQPQAVTDENEAFFLPTVDAGQVREPGQSIGRLVMRGRLMNDDFALTERAKAWIAATRREFGGAYGG